MDRATGINFRVHIDFRRFTGSCFPASAGLLPGRYFIPHVCRKRIDQAQVFSLEAHCLEMVSGVSLLVQDLADELSQRLFHKWFLCQSADTDFSDFQLC